MKLRILGSVIASTAILATTAVAADTKKTVVKDGVSFGIEDRMRYEGVSQPNTTTNEDATAITNRFLMGVKYKKGNLSVDVEALNVSALDDSYNDTDPSNTDPTSNGKPYSVVVDPEQTRITQAKLTYKADKTTVIAGRQMINLDGQRFVGAVDWRQMRQTFDAFVLANSSVKDLTLTGAYVLGVNGVKTDNNSSAADGRWETESAIINAKYKASKTLDILAYSYMLGSVHDTYGLAFTGKAGKDGAFKYSAEYAMQTDASIEIDASTDIDVPASGPALADASYVNIDLSYTLDKKMTFGLNYEVLSGDADSNATTGTATAFSTPLATLHKFNGWADQFLGSTPDQGLVDTNVRFMYKTKEMGKFLAVYHTFDSQAGASVNYGTELNILYTNKIKAVKGLSYLIKYADFSKGDTASAYADATKIWASLTYKYASK